MNTVNFDKQKLAKLKSQYNKAIKDGKESFIFDSNELLVSYAKYLIEYLETIFNKK